MSTKMSTLNEVLNKEFFVNYKNETIIQFPTRWVLSEDEANDLALEIQSLKLRKMMGDEINNLEKLMLSALLNSN